MTPEWWMLWLMLLLQIIILVFVLIIHDGVKNIWRKLEVVATHIVTIVKSTGTTQSSVRTRLKSDGVDPVIEKPKAKQHYEGRGVQRVARGGKTEEAGWESSPARIGSVKRRSYGGTSGDSFSS